MENGPSDKDRNPRNVYTFRKTWEVSQDWVVVVLEDGGEQKQTPMTNSHQEKEDREKAPNPQITGLSPILLNSVR